MLFYFYGKNTQELRLHSGYLYPRWFRLVFLGNPSNQGDGKTEFQWLFGTSWQGQFTLPVGKLSFISSRDFPKVTLLCLFFEWNSG